MAQSFYSNMKHFFQGKWITTAEFAPLKPINVFHKQLAPAAEQPDTEHQNRHVLFRPDLPSANEYRVQLAWNASATRSTAVRVEVVHAEGVETNLVDMTVQGEEDGGWWTSIGTFPFEAGTDGSVRILTEGQDDNYVIADAARFELVEPAPAGDADANGLPDLWERRHFLQRTGTDPNGDPDGDGLRNLGEWLADTDPHDASSLFRIGGITCGAASSGVSRRVVTLSWPSVEGRTYTVLRAERLGEPFAAYLEHIPATPPENVIDLPPDDSDSAFYRVAIDIP